MKKNLANTIMTIVKKETQCILRDKRILILILLLPLFLAPLLLTIIKSATQPTNTSMVYRFATNNSSQESLSPLITSELFIQAECLPQEAHNLIKKDKIDIYIFYEDDESITFLYNSSSTKSSNALSIASTMLREQYYMENSLRLHDVYGIPIEESTVTFKSQFEDVYGNEYGSMIILLIPMTILTYCCYGVSCIAGEMTVTEHERGTYDPLIATGVQKGRLIAGKSIVTTLFGCISGMFAFAGLYLYAYIDGNATIRFNANCLISLFCTVFMIAVFFSAFLIFVGIISKSFKEYQAYSSVITILCMIPTFFTMTAGLNSLPDYYYFIPLLNHTILIKEVITDQIYPIHFLLVLLSTSIIVVIAFALSHSYCQTE